MKTETSYKTFGYGKSINEILYNTNLWADDFIFIKKELIFLKKIIQSYPYSANIPNLFEKIQLFVKDLSNLENEKGKLNHEVSTYKSDLLNEEEHHHLDHDNYYLMQYQNLAKSIFNYKKNYKILKGNIFEYLESVIEINETNKQAQA